MKVKCVNSTESNDNLTAAKIYDAEIEGELYRLLDDHGTHSIWFQHRFETLPELPPITTHIVAVRSQRSAILISTYLIDLVVPHSVDFTANGIVFTVSTELKEFLIEAWNKAVKV